MKKPDLTIIEDDEYLQCLNCGYTDIAKTWKGNSLKACIMCKSEAFKKVYIRG